MRGPFSIARCCFLAGMGCIPVAVFAQAAPSAPAAQPSSACPPSGSAGGQQQANSPCAATAPPSSAADRFPYPGSTAPVTPPSSTPLPAAPSGTSGAPTTPGSSAGKRFPYPGEDDSTQPAAPQPAQPPAGTPPLQDAGSSGQTTSSSSSSSSSHPSNGDAGDPNASDPDANDPAAVPRKDRHKAPTRPRQTPTQRELEDVQVAGFYFNDGNFLGSYDRAKDAVSLDDGDADAQLALGNAARKLGKLDEAERAYRRVLELDPVPKVRKPAERALKEMTGSG